MANLLIIGAGQYGNVVYELANSTANFETIDFLDDNNEKAIGKLSDIESYQKLYDMAIVAIGNPEIRLNYLDLLEAYGYTIPVLISPFAYVSPTAKIQKGSIIEPMAVIHNNTDIGKGCIICAGAVVNHNATIKSGCQIDCNATVPAQASLPQNTKLESGCVYSSNQ